VLDGVIADGALHEELLDVAGDAMFVDVERLVAEVGAN
jgi:hypothetical protein